MFSLPMLPMIVESGEIRQGHVEGVDVIQWSTAENYIIIEHPALKARDIFGQTQMLIPTSLWPWPWQHKTTPHKLE
jgi:hypothetical protein